MYLYISQQRCQVFPQTIFLYLSKLESIFVQIAKCIPTLTNKGARCFHVKQYSSFSPDVLAKSNFTFDVAK